jgi:secondary thiamine-phosphate synthase enzyme
MHQVTLEVTTRGRSFVDVTAQVASVVRAARVRTGLCHLFVQHTSASLLVQENADPRVLADLERWLDRLAPEGHAYAHDDEGPDDMPSHLKSAVTKTSELVPVSGHALALGTWQAIYLAEHRRAPHRRRIVCTVWGDDATPG